MTLALFSSHKKGVSSYQLAKYINITQKSAWFVLHRLRLVFKRPGSEIILLDNSVEIDETFIRGRIKTDIEIKKFLVAKVETEKTKFRYWAC